MIPPHGRARSPALWGPQTQPYSDTTDGYYVDKKFVPLSQDNGDDYINVRGGGDRGVARVITAGGYDPSLEVVHVHVTATMIICQD